MNRVYPSRIEWENEPSTNTPINETNLNKMDYAIYEIDGRVVTFDLTKANQSDLLQTVKNVTYDTETGIFTFTFWNGSTVTADLNIEKIPVSFRLTEQGVLIMTTADGTQYTCDIAALIKIYTFADSTEIDFTTTTDASGNKTITAQIKAGSITGDKLQPNYLADCVDAKNSAQTAETNAHGYATDADASRLESEGFAVGEQNGEPVEEGSPYYHNNAKYYAQQSDPTRLESLSDVSMSTKKDKDLLMYDITDDKWENKQATELKLSDEKTTTTGKFKTINGGKLESCIVGIVPKQDLHGYNNPWVGGSGKNKLQTVNTTRTINGITYTVQDDGSFIANRVEASSNLSYFVITNSSNSLDTTQITPFKSGMTIYPTSGINGFPLRFRYSNGDFGVFSENTAITLTNDIVAIYVQIESNLQPSNFHFYPMIRVDGDNTWEPYSNVCPITGHSSVEVTVSDEDETVVEDVTVNLGGTYYGGTLDVVSGKLTITHAYADLGSFTWTQYTTSQTGKYRFGTGDLGNVIKKPSTLQEIADVMCSQYDAVSGESPYACVQGVGVHTNGNVIIYDSTKDTLSASDFKTAMSGVQFVYPLTTPIVIQLTPQQINTLIGENNIDVPLTGQSLTSAVYRELFAWDDVEDVVEELDTKKADISSIGTDESGRTTASKAYAIGEHFYKDGKFCTAKTAIASGATFTLNTNYVEGDIASVIDGKFAVIELTTDASDANNAVQYPTGFTQNNCVPLSLLIKDGSDNWRSAEGALGASMRFFVTLMSGQINISAISSEYKGKDAKLTLMRLY